MQISMFDGSQQLRITKPIRLIELFAGIGAQAKALERLGVDFEHYRVVEFDKYAIKSYNAIHGTDFPTMDITETHADDLGIVDTDKYDYIMTYSFPCTDLSSAGKMQGMSRDSGTRSGLLWEVERLLKETKELPQFLLMENVPEVIGQKNIKDFAEWIAFLDSLGYTSKWAVMNTKDYGVPQNRERCFMLSWLADDCFYDFLQPYKLTKRLKDILEMEVEEKYYLSERALLGAINTNFNCSSLENRLPKDGISPTLCARDYKDPKLVQVMQLGGAFESGGRVYDADGLCPTISTCAGGNREPKIVEPIAYDEQNQYFRNDGCVGTLTTDGSSPKHNNRVVIPNFIERGIAESHGEVVSFDPNRSENFGYRKPMPVARALRAENNNASCIIENYRIRKLTPLECWRLMDFDDKDFYAAQAVNSNAQLYKQAGNSIVVNCLVEILKRLF